MNVSSKDFDQLFDEVREFYKVASFAVGEKHQEICKKYRLLQLTTDCFNLKSSLYAPMTLSSGQTVLFILGSKNDFNFTDNHLTMLLRLAPQILLGIENFLAFQQVKALKDRLEQEKNYLAEEIKAVYNFNEIIGSSPLILEVFKNVGQVAKTDVTVLIYGETGTGKELVARALHHLSPRKTQPLIKINCASLPAQLIESELFGHEKGSFTGAVESRAGKFELAQNGTIFLDEIGELHLELQAKLLRVLQEKEIERIGGKKVIKVDVRIISATNRDLEKEIAAGKFRSDLYYRLDVFPVRLPTLRERKEDIPMLAMHFIQKCAKRFGKNVVRISDAALQELMGYPFPGNIRELEHIIEQSMVVANSNELDLVRPLRHTESRPAAKGEKEFELQTMHQAERVHILATLKYTGGKIRGIGGASELLDMKPSTLESRMKKLGIKREHV
jgi:formate hydrogenlyase transcriptional activator